MEALVALSEGDSGVRSVGVGEGSGMERMDNQGPYQPRTPPMAEDDPVVQWLLQGDPAIRWQVLRDLVNASETDLQPAVVRGNRPAAAVGRLRRPHRGEVPRRSVQAELVSLRIGHHDVARAGSRRRHITAQTGGAAAICSSPCRPGAARTSRCRRFLAVLPSPRRGSKRGPNAETDAALRPPRRRPSLAAGVVTAC